MHTLYLLAPRSKNNPSSRHRDFYTILANGVGPDYGISTGQMGQIHSGMPVILFDRDRALQARGTVTSCSATTRAANGVQRYNVTVRGFSREPYTHPPRMNRFGVAIY